MNIYTIFGFIGAAALLITLIRFFLQRPSNIFIVFVQNMVACLFIFSGLIKENDTIGFSYKLEEYFEVFKTTDSVEVAVDTPILQPDTVFQKNAVTGIADTLITQKQTGVDHSTSWTVKESDSFFNKTMDFFHDYALELGFLILVLEVMLGLMLLIGAWRNLTLIFLFLMTAFFTYLTYYSAANNAVKECGCFGDFLHMTPWESFGKDVFLLALILILVFGKKYITPLFGKNIEKGSLVVFLLFSFSFPLYTYNFLPVKDFRPYAVGKNILEGMKLPPDAKCDSIVMIFTYEKAGVQFDLTTDQLKTIDSTCKFVDRKDKMIREGDKPAIHDFSIVSAKDGSDYTETILNYNGYYFFLVAYDLDKTSLDAFGKINDFAKLCRQDSIPFICLTASSDKIDSFKKTTGADMDFYLTDQTTLKTMIRSNPGLMLLKKGTVMDMWHHHSIPSYTDVKNTYLSK